MNTLFQDLTQKAAFWITTQFGGKKGFVNYWFYKGMYCFRTKESSLDFRDVTRLIFVCSGNICRSPFAEYYAKSKGLEALSYGLHATGSNLADKDAVNAAQKRNIDLSHHTSTNISEYIYKEGDVLLGFEPEHIENLLKLPIQKTAPILLLGQFHSPKVPYIHDPFMIHPLYFDNCFTIIEQSIDAIHQLMGENSHG